ncbi:class I SAM-dependent methyltransferase [Streptomyces sp. NBC_00237]|uniref:class I SAM-dependent methyltransferase n=1 Tax=Streptomyces sp. NBC_00237 TaxID=2975687 RepID=UPI0022571AE1|nr:class I SAM-dependent methyltransferase [Streptomyces sp. NBC_00237]MCX5200753.1 class I SAM-dependent methyltransferase [Streptomyces sp. NBC_00237]
MPLLTHPLARRALRPLAALVDQRVRSQTRATRTEIGALRTELDALKKQSTAVGMLLDRTGRGAHRMPSEGQISTLVAQVAEVSGSSHARRAVTSAFRTVVALEALGVGRMAGGTSNVCGKLATIPLLAPPASPDVLEIGTLYGLFATSLTRMLHREGIEARLTIVDPLIGSQLQPDAAREAADPTGTPVREDVVRANLALASAPANSNYRIQKGFSQDADVRKAVSDRRYGVVVVDGDHSREGVLADLQWVEEIVADGGVVVLDDYGDTAWPGVGEALDEHLASGGSRLELLGRVATSAFLRARPAVSR